VSSRSTGTISYTVQNPTTFIVCDWDKDHCDWHYSPETSAAVERWSPEKTIYDPCPAGWIVPDEDFWDVCGLPVNDFSNFDDYVDTSYKGFVVGSDYCTPDAWYPASGMRVYWNDFSDEFEYVLVGAGSYGCYWTTGESGILYTDGYADGGSWDGRYGGHSVRCQKE
jgi:hypothetical protein